MLHGGHVIIATSSPPDRPYYRRDLLACMARPSGYVARFHYKKHWISNSVLSHLPEKGNFGSVVFCDLEHPGAIQSPTIPYLRLRSLPSNQLQTFHFFGPRITSPWYFGPSAFSASALILGTDLPGPGSRRYRQEPKGRSPARLTILNFSLESIARPTTWAATRPCPGRLIVRGSRRREHSLTASFFKFTGIFKCSNPFEVPKTSPEKPNNDVYELRSNKTYKSNCNYSIRPAAKNLRS